MPMSSKKVFEFLGVKSNIDSIYSMIIEYNNNNREEFINPLAIVKMEQEWDGNLICELGITGFLLLDEVKPGFYYFGNVGLVKANDELVNIRGVCDQADYRWAVSYFETLGQYLMRSFGEQINNASIYTDIELGADQTISKDKIQTFLPGRPNDSATLELWFDYYHKMKNAGYKYTLKDLANDCGLSHSYIRQEHPNYRRSKGL